jgi:hypothetical protein
MKTLAKMAMFLALLMAATTTHADDAAMKKELLGYWKSGRHAYLYKDDGIVYMMGGTTAPPNRDGTSVTGCTSKVATLSVVPLGGVRKFWLSAKPSLPLHSPMALTL